MSVERNPQIRQANAGLPRKGEPVLAAAVLDVEEPLRDVDVGRAVLPHRSELHQVSLGHLVAHRVEQVEGAHQVVVVGEDTVLDVHHAVRCRRHLAKMDDRLGPQGSQTVAGETEVAEITLAELEVGVESLLKGIQALGHPADRGRGLGAHLGHPVAS